MNKDLAYDLLSIAGFFGATYHLIKIRKNLKKERDPIKKLVLEEIASGKIKTVEEANVAYEFYQIVYHG